MYSNFINPSYVPVLGKSVALDNSSFELRSNCNCTSMNRPDKTVMSINLARCSNVLQAPRARLLSVSKNQYVPYSKSTSMTHDYSILLVAWIDSSLFPKNKLS